MYECGTPQTRSEVDLIAFHEVVRDGWRTWMTHLCVNASPAEFLAKLESRRPS